MRQLRPLLCAAAALLILMANPAGAAVTYIVTVNTSSVTGTSGFLDFQFNPGNSSSQAATATITSFIGGTVVGAPQIVGNVTGTLPATVTFVNSTALNEAFQGFTYGGAISFVLTLSGPAIDTPNGTATAGTTFGVGLYDSGQNPILTDQGQTTGFAAQVDINLNGTTTATAFPVGTSVVAFQTLNRPTISKAFGLGNIPVNGTSSLSFTITNPAPAGGATLHGITFTDPLPSGIVVGAPNGLAGTCNGTVPTAVAGSNTVSLAGATLAAGASCTFSVNVRGVSPGPQLNTTSTVTTNEGVTGDPATANIGVAQSVNIPVMSMPVLAGFALLLAGLGAFLARRAQTLR